MEFLTLQNKEYLLNTLSNIIEKKYNFKITNDEEFLLYNIMDIYKNHNDTIYNKNKTVLEHTIKIILKKIQENLKNQQLDEKNVLETPEDIRKHQEDRKKIAVVKTKYLTIDSRQRNITDYPETFKYSLDIDPIINVLSIELISAEIPKTEYLVNSSNNKIYFQELISQQNNNTYNITTIPTGNYSLSTLKTAIETNMNNSSITGAVYFVDTITFAPQNKITISSDMGGTTQIFNLIFYGGTEEYNETFTSKYPENSIGPLIGFSIKNFTGSTSYTSDNQLNLYGENYLFLQINNFKTVENSSSNVKNIFAKISLDTNDNVKYFKNNDEYRIIKKFKPVLLRLDRLNISFLKYNGDFYDFNGVDHSLLFKVETLNYKK